MTRGPLTAFHRANAVTYLSLMSSLAAVAAASRGFASTAGALIALAVIADTFDGRYAKQFLRTADERSVGVQLDSLSDAIAFGAAPAICMTLLAPPSSAGLALGWWIAVAIFAACAIARLAFYNVTHDDVDGFVGLPVPVAALIWSTVLLATPGPATSIAVLLTTAAAMVVPLPVPRPRGAALALFALWPAAIVLAHAIAGWRG